MRCMTTPASAALHKSARCDPAAVRCGNQSRRVNPPPIRSCIVLKLNLELHISRAEATHDCGDLFERDYQDSQACSTCFTDSTKTSLLLADAHRFVSRDALAL